MGARPLPRVYAGAGCIRESCAYGISPARFFIFNFLLTAMPAGAILSARKQTMTINSETIKIKANDACIRNEMHFDVQRRTRMNVFRDRTVYTRKEKHRRRFEW